MLRDLGWLMNTVHLQATQDLSWVPEAQSSVINYGLPDLAGSHLISHDVGELERELVKAILAFEPRILADSLVVKAQIDEQRMNRSALIFSIKAEVWSQPVPQSVQLKTELQLETGLMTVLEQRR